MKVLVSVKVYNKEAKFAEVGDIFYYANILSSDVFNCHGYNNVYTTEERFCLIALIPEIHQHYCRKG